MNSVSVSDANRNFSALPKSYEPEKTEARRRAFWEEQRLFTPDLGKSAEAGTFSIVIPPPNITGNLHMGHALNLTLQDILCRRRRQLGEQVLWVPGADHAGIATQNVVERRLEKEGISRHDLGREAFVERIRQWKDEYGDNIRRQIKAMGASVDWSRERFTLDEGLSRAVRKVFVRLYHEGLIYKGTYIVNWCSRCRTALADDEVEHRPLKGALYLVRYPLEDGSGHILVATTRPETMLGDTALAVHPEDGRHLGLIGKKARLPLLDRLLPIIADPYVDREFGTGVLKVTPAHDPDDWHLGHKHGLEFIRIMDEDGDINDKGGVYRGLSMEKARETVVADLREGGFLKEVRPYEHNVGHCYRCSSVIEPLLSEQWFVAVKSLAEKARAAVPEQTRIFPSSWLKTYYNWLDNIRDWCISRQIWWGHRIPAWTCDACGEQTVREETPQHCPKCSGSSLTQDPDVLDTWFSSALWPFSALGWPDKTPELERFYPTSILVTGFDILFFWVARMMMMGLHFMGEAPFRRCYLHALVRDAQGKKMSKSRGNVIDPLEMTARYGTDSLRFTLASFAAMGRDIRLSEERIEGCRHFMNKIWNAARFALMNAEGLSESPCPDGVRGLHHRWILYRLEELKKLQHAALDEYRFNDAAQGLYRFVWNDLCDWYLELIKTDLRGEERPVAQAVLFAVLRETLVLLHPFIPFITSEIWDALPGRDAVRDIALTPFPAPRDVAAYAGDAGRMELLQGAVTAVRTIRAELNIPPAHKAAALIRPLTPEAHALFEDRRQVLMSLAGLDKLETDPAVEAPKASARSVSCGNEIIVPLAGLVDFAVEAARLDKELAKLDKERAALAAKLANPAFVEKAPAEIVERDRARVTELGEAEVKLRVFREIFSA
ncbi:MAG: valine--tRNA ligase [Desulfovibrio sp.]|nr:valine--tRNA ligase [Desulfovibrio sp.]